MKYLLFVFILFLVSCSTRFETKHIQGKHFEIENVFSENKVYNILFFLSPECPLCVNYTLNIKQLQKELSKDSFNIIGVFSGEYYPIDSIKNYLVEYNLEINAVLDPEFDVAHHLKATVTPEVFIISPKGDVVYSGKIDNWMESLSIKRTIITEKYLEEVLFAIRHDLPLPYSKTEPIGCFIE